MRISPQTLARASSRRPWVVVGIWVAAIVGSLGVSSALLGDALTNEGGFVNNPEAKRAAQLVEGRLRGESQTTEQLVDEGENAPTIVPPEDSGPAGDLSGGATYTVDATSNVPGAVAQMTTLSGGGISVRDIGQGHFTSLSGESVGTPDVQLIFDLDAGTLSGSFDANYACDVDTCNGSSATGYARASFGPIPFGLAPTSVPSDFPFPEHHWTNPPSDSWYAGQAVPIEVSLVGTDYSGNNGDYTTTVTGWVYATLSSKGSVTGSLPYGWGGSFFATLDYPDTVNPQWYFGLWAQVDIWDGNVPAPPES